MRSTPEVNVFQWETGVCCACKIERKQGYFPIGPMIKRYISYSKIVPPTLPAWRSGHCRTGSARVGLTVSVCVSVCLSLSLSLSGFEPSTAGAYTRTSSALSMSPSLSGFETPIFGLHAWHTGPPLEYIDFRCAACRIEKTGVFSR